MTVEDLSSGLSFDDHCHILINAGGYLNSWAWPNVPGTHDFEGQMIHSASWNTDICLDGKKVGLIGNG